MSNGPIKISQLPVATSSSPTQDLMIVVQNTAGTNTTYSITPSVLMSSYLPTYLSTYTGTVNAASYSVGTLFVANATATYIGNTTANVQIGGLNVSGTPSALAGYGSSNSSVDIVITNANNSTNASSDFAAYDNNGLVGNNFIDMGISSSGYSNTFWTINGPSDGYIYTGNTNLTIGTASYGGGTNYINFFTGGTLAANERMRITSTGKVGIGTTSPGTATILDVQSTTAGVRFPNMTTTQKTALTPAAGTVVFDTTLAKLCLYTGAAWQTITSA